jgi:hypothetical protein
MKFLCLANSYKTGGRCVAGIDIGSGKWVRPVSTQNSGELLSESSIVETEAARRFIRPFDVVDIGNPIKCPIPGQPENVERGTNKWTLLEEVHRSTALKFVQREGLLIYGNYDRIDAKLSEHVQKSLTIIKVTNPSFQINSYGKLRGRFVFSGKHYDFSVTDDAPWTNDAKIQPINQNTGDWLLTISLGVPWSPPNSTRNPEMYKLIAGAFKL